MKTILQLLICVLLSGTPVLSMAQTANQGGDLILIRSASRSPGQVIDAVKDYAEAKKWVYMGSNTVMTKQGMVSMVKFCIPQVGGILWNIGLQMSAMLPCGNVGVYEKQGKTEISMLHPRYMQILFPHPDVEKAVNVATPLLMEMLDTVAN